MIKYKVQRAHFVKNLITVTGTTQSGKSLIGPIICSFKGAENYRTDFVLEQIPMLHHLGLISDQVAIFMLRYGIELMQHDNMIGRNSNFRFSDFSSIWKTNDPSEFFKRLTMPEGKDVYKRLEKEPPLFVLNFHNGVIFSSLFFQAFPDQKILNIVRNPIDVAFAWYNKDYGKLQTYATPRISTLTYNYKNKLLPYYAKGWEDEYLDIGEMDRVIGMLYNVHMMHIKSYNNLKEEDKNNILIIEFDDFALNTEKNINEISSFLNASQTIHTSLVCQREKVPREIDKLEVEKKMKFIKSKSSAVYFEKISELINLYQSNTLV